MATACIGGGNTAEDGDDNYVLKNIQEIRFFSIDEMLRKCYDEHKSYKFTFILYKEEIFYVDLFFFACQCGWRRVRIKF
jgi:hypothetical protein